MQITDTAATKVAGMKSGEEHLRVYITGGGCSGFNYGFISVSYTHLTLPTN